MVSDTLMLQWKVAFRGHHHYDWHQGHQRGQQINFYGHHIIRDIRIFQLVVVGWLWCRINRSEPVEEGKGQHLHSRCFFLGAITSWVVALQTARAISDPVSWYCAAAMRSVSVCPDIFSPLRRPAQEFIPPEDERMIYVLMHFTWSQRAAGVSRVSPLTGWIGLWPSMWAEKQTQKGSCQ